MKLLLIILLVFVPSICFAEGIIGVDTQFSFTPVNFLTTNPENPEYSQVFNFFFTLELFAGLMALWLRLLFRVIRQ